MFNSSLSRVMRKPAFYICEKDADQLIRAIDSTIPLLSKSEISTSVVVTQPGLCRTWIGTPLDRFSRDVAHSVSTTNYAFFKDSMVSNYVLYDRKESKNRHNYIN